jgi:acyl-CoA thioesterase
MSTEQAAGIVAAMYEKDRFSQWLGIERVEVGEGRCVLRMTIREEMCNGFGIAHGAIAYALADSALAFAANTRGRQAMSVETSISHLAPLRAGESISAHASEESLRDKIAIYRVEVRRADATLAALFKGTVYRTEKQWEI